MLLRLACGGQGRIHVLGIAINSEKGGPGDCICNIRRLS